MKVICIIDGWETCSSTNNPKLNEVYTVVNSELEHGKLWYTFKEFPSNQTYNSEGFIPLDQYLEQFTGALTKELEQLQLV